jgi:hypothetical protein
MPKGFRFMSEEDIKAAVAQELTKYFVVGIHPR